MLSNRVFDALACGAPVVSDEMAGLPDGFAGFIDTFRADRPIGRAIASALEEDEGRRAARRAFAEIVRRDHCFDRRAETILGSARALIEGRRQAGSAA
jgi:spore maturation protein CgeB